MNENRPMPHGKVLAALLGGFALAAVHQYLFYGGGYGVSVPIFAGLFYLYLFLCARDRFQRPMTWFGWLSLAAVVLLSLTYALFANSVFFALNLLALPGLIFAQTTYMFNLKKRSWGDLRIIFDVLDHLLPQNFRHWATAFRAVQSAATKKMGDRRKQAAGKVLLGLLIALPLLIVVTGLLTSADSSFDRLLSAIPDWLNDSLSFGDVMFRLIWILLLGLLLFGYLWGFVDPMRENPVDWFGGIPMADGMRQTGAVRSDTVQSGAVQSDMIQSDMVQSGAGEGGAGVSSTVQNDAGRNGTSGAGRSATLPGATAAASPYPGSTYPGSRPVRIDPLIAATVLISINIVYLLFVSLQFTYLFGAWRGVLPDGSTYADYARSGFVELVLVTSINFAILIGTLTLGGEAGKALRTLNQALLYILVGCSGIMLLSAFTRLALYQEAYGYTYIRFLVFAFMIFLALLLVCAGLRIRFARVPLAKCFIGLGLAAYVAVNYANMDLFIAKKNVERYEATGKIDAHYLTTLSADALPWLVSYSRKADPELNRQLHERWDVMTTIPEGQGWPGFNWAKFRAVRALEEDRNR
ncbi:DUF4173 domain-containing protein [Paenibacillus macerans]|uniref:DUF4153 domain-containing protein n=1 Tax=Paenibacillus macerans TaxID=44252 RepID=UPI002E21218F|nr:DUF4173 domain-containing protein [Paenibacillus macerans]